MSAAEAMDTTKNDVKAPLGMQLGIYAAGVHWVSALVLIIGIVTSEGDHSDEWSAKYPEFPDRLAVMYDFNHTDSANLLQDRFAGHCRHLPSAGTPFSSSIGKGAGVSRF